MTRLFRTLAVAVSGSVGWRPYKIAAISAALSFLAHHRRAIRRVTLVATDRGAVLQHLLPLQAMMRTTMETLKPEAAYFGPDGGFRTAFIVFDLKDPHRFASGGPVTGGTGASATRDHAPLDGGWEKLLERPSRWRGTRPVARTPPSTIAASV